MTYHQFHSVVTELYVRRLIYFLFYSSLCALTWVHRECHPQQKTFSFHSNKVQSSRLVLLFYFCLFTYLFVFVCCFLTVIFFPVVNKMEKSLFHQVKAEMCVVILDLTFHSESPPLPAVRVYMLLIPFQSTQRWRIAQLQLLKSYKSMPVRYLLQQYMKSFPSFAYTITGK